MGYDLFEFKGTYLFVTPCISLEKKIQQERNLNISNGSCQVGSVVGSTRKVNVLSLNETVK